jgi:hypothetical protein
MEKCQQSEHVAPFDTACESDGGNFIIVPLQVSQWREAKSRAAVSAKEQVFLNLYEEGEASPLLPSSPIVAPCPGDGSFSIFFTGPLMPP